LGAFIATALIYANYYSAIQIYDEGIRSAYGSNTSTGHIFTTFPAEHVTLAGALLDQVLLNGT
jgi:glycerol uptake facilitator-like aquaporin